MSQWTEINNQAAAEHLMGIFGAFHDGCIREVHLSTDHWVDDDMSMVCSDPKLSNRVRVLVQRQFRDPAAIEMLFDEVIRFNFAPPPPDYDAIIMQAKLLVDESGIHWAAEPEWSPGGADCDDCTWISARKLRWRAVDWVGSELRYGPGEQD